MSNYKHYIYVCICGLGLFRMKRSGVPVTWEYIMGFPPIVIFVRDFKFSSQFPTTNH